MSGAETRVGSARHDAGTRGPGRAGGGVLVATVALVAFALWRVRLGADLGDGTHVVALAMRMAQGDQVFVDEMNLQALGSVAAVPFTWLWLELVGVEGVVLASRVFYVALGLGVGAVAYSALRTRLSRAVAFAAVVLMLLPTPYNLLVTSYNTMPVLMLGLAACAGFAAVTTRSSRWGACSGVALAVAVLSHPVSLPAAVVLGVTVLVLARRGPAATGLLVGGGLASALVVAVLLLGPGPGALLETVRYTADYQAERPEPFARAARSLQRYLLGVVEVRHLPTFVLLVLALVPRVAWRWRVAAALAVPVSLALTSWLVAPDESVGGEPFGLYSGAFALLLLTFLAGPVGAWAFSKAGDRDLRLLLVLTAPTAVLGLLAFAMTTSASIRWGAPVPPALPLLGAVGAGLVLWAGRHGTRVLAVVGAVALVGSLLAVHPLRSFRDGTPGTMQGPVTAGPLAGLHTREEQLEQDGELRDLVQTWVGPQDGVFFYGIPGGYAYSTAAMQTNLIWIGSFGEANGRTVRWWEETGRRPDVALVGAAPVRAAGGWPELAASDPVIAHLDEHYELVVEPTEQEGDVLVLVSGEAPPAGGR